MLSVVFAAAEMRCEIQCKGTLNGEYWIWMPWGKQFWGLCPKGTGRLGAKAIVSSDVSRQTWGFYFFKAVIGNRGILNGHKSVSTRAFGPWNTARNQNRLKTQKASLIANLLNIPDQVAFMDEEILEGRRDVLLGAKELSRHKERAWSIVYLKIRLLYVSESAEKGQPCVNYLCISLPLLADGKFSF